MKITMQYTKPGCSTSGCTHWIGVAMSLLYTSWLVSLCLGYSFRHHQTTAVAKVAMPPDFALAQSPASGLPSELLTGTLIWSSLMACVAAFMYTLVWAINLDLGAVSCSARCFQATLKRVLTLSLLLLVLMGGFEMALPGVLRSVADIGLGALGGLIRGPVSSSRVENKNIILQNCQTRDGACKLGIPKIIHQTYKTTDLPSQWRDTPKAWQNMHPDWEYMFWTDASAREFISTEYPWFLSTFDSYDHPIQRADAIRYFALYHYGGLYADMDLQPRESLEPYLSDSEVILFETPNMGLTNMILASQKHSPFMKCVAAKLSSHKWQFHHWLVPFKSWKILSGTGPTYLWGMSSHSLCGQSFLTRERLRIISSEASGRCSLCRGLSVAQCHQHGFLKHLVGSSWHTSDVQFLHFVFLCHPGISLGIGIGAYMVLSYMCKYFSGNNGCRHSCRSAVLRFLVLLIVCVVLYVSTENFARPSEADSNEPNMLVPSGIQRRDSSRQNQNTWIEAVDPHNQWQNIDHWPRTNT